MDGQPARRDVSRHRAGPAQPRHQRRAVLRSRLRLRRHAAVAHAARPLHAARRGAGHAAVPRGLVGVGLHHLGHQLARSRPDAGPHPAVPLDARRPRAVDLDPDRVRGTRPVVCGRLCGDAGRPHAVLAARDAAASHAGAPQRDPHPGLAMRLGGVLDARRLCRGRDAAVALDRRARDRICLAGGAVLDAGTRLLLGRSLGGRRRPYGRALRRLHHHRARRSRSSSMARLLPI